MGTDSGDQQRAHYPGARFRNRSRIIHVLQCGLTAHEEIGVVLGPHASCDVSGPDLGDTEVDGSGACEISGPGLWQ